MLPLNITARTTLGAKLVLSSAYFQASSAELIGAEGEKLQTIAGGVSVGSLANQALTTANLSIRRTVEYLSGIEEQILKKINAGTTLHNSPLWVL